MRGKKDSKVVARTARSRVDDVYIVHRINVTEHYILHYSHLITMLCFGFGGSILGVRYSLS